MKKVRWVFRRYASVRGSQLGKRRVSESNVSLMSVVGKTLALLDEFVRNLQCLEYRLEHKPHHLVLKDAIQRINIQFSLDSVE